MDWLRRIGDSSPSSTGATDEPAPEPVEGAAPGAAAVFRGISPDDSHAVLDLGPGVDSSLRVYQRFARRIQFADLLASRSHQGLAEALKALPERPYDLVFAWNILDRLFPAERSRLMQRLAEVSAADARLHVVLRASEGTTGTHRLRFALLDVDRMRYEPVGPTRPNRRRLLPAEVEDLLAPFQVQRGFTLKGGLREYVAVREATTHW